MKSVGALHIISWFLSAIPGVRYRSRSWNPKFAYPWWKVSSKSMKGLWLLYKFDFLEWRFGYAGEQVPPKVCAPGYVIQSGQCPHFERPYLCNKIPHLWLIYTPSKSLVTLRYNYFLWYLKMKEAKVISRLSCCLTGVASQNNSSYMLHKCWHDRKGM